MKKIVMGSLLIASISVAMPAFGRDINALIDEATSLRAGEFSPHEYRMAKEMAAVRNLGESEKHAGQAINNCMIMNKYFSALIDSRDRMQLAKAEEVRQDLAEHAEEAFARVVAAVEDGDLPKAGKEAETASLLTRQAEIVAAREQLTRPIARKVSEARAVEAATYAPALYDAIKESLSDIERSIRDNPAAQGASVNKMQLAVATADKAIAISRTGKAIKRNPALMQQLIEASDSDMQKIAELAGTSVSPAQTHAGQTATILAGISSMKQSFKADLEEANRQISALNGNMGELDEVRFKLKLKREAEAKIAQLASLFDPAQVEIFLTTDADVIIRMKSMNFRSGSAVIPPDSYMLLDVAGKAVELFGDRKVRVEGHTDAVGQDDYNQELSERRANTVREYLEVRFEGKQRTFTAIGLGEQKPIANNEREEGRQKNRRIDIVLIAPQR